MLGKLALSPATNPQDYFYQNVNFNYIWILRGGYAVGKVTNAALARLVFKPVKLAMLKALKKSV